MDEHKITIIKPVEEPSAVDDPNHKYNVCFYCRVSTNKQSQKGSLDNQKSFMTYELERHPNWVIDMEKDVYFDEGLSGTTEKKRDAFNKMVKLAKEGKYDLIVTKEVSRVFRNSRKLLELIDDLKKQGIYIWFLGENLCTQRERDYEYILSSANRSEIESHYISKRVKIGQNASYRNGVVFGPNRMLGYKIIKEGYKQKFVIVEEEAKLVRKIFEMYADGHGTFQIAKAMEKLDKEREENPLINTEELCIPKWSCTSVLRILKNEKYVGDLVLGKTYTPNVLDHKKVMNTKSKSYMVFHENHHPEEAIISRELWNEVQAELSRNAVSAERKRKHSNRFWCSGKLVCGVCGESYISKSKNQKAVLENGEQYVSKRWVCFRNQNYGSKAPDGCPNTSVNDKVIQDLKEGLVSALFNERDSIIAAMERSLKEAKEEPIEKLEEEIDALNVEKIEWDAMLNSIYKDQLKGIFTEAEADKKKMAIIAEQRRFDIRIDELERKIVRLKYGETEEKKQVKQIKNFFEQKPEEVSDEFARRIIDRIVVYPYKRLAVYFTFEKDKPHLFEYETKGKMESYEIKIYPTDSNPYLEEKDKMKTEE